MSKLFYDYQSLLREGEGHKALLKLAGRINDETIDKATNLISFEKTKKSYSIVKDPLINKKKIGMDTNTILQTGSNMTGRIADEMDLVLSRMDDLLKQYSEKNIEEVKAYLNV
jgi:transcriptional regulator of heat shock response